MGEVSCVAAAFLFLTSNVLASVYMTLHRMERIARAAANGEDTDAHFNYELFKSLDTTTIVNSWIFRMEQRPLELAHSLVNALAWILFTIPILKIVWLQSERLTRSISIHIPIAAFAMAGCCTEVISRLLYIGSTNALEWLANDFALDGWVNNNNTSEQQIGWKVLEMIHLVNSGMLLWIDAAEFFFLSVILTLIYVSTYQGVTSEDGYSYLSLRWARFGLVIAALSFLEFLFSLLRFEDWRFFSRWTMIINILSRSILFPAWLLWLAKQLSVVPENIQGYVPTYGRTTTTRTVSANKPTTDGADEATESHHTNTEDMVGISMD